MQCKIPICETSHENNHSKERKPLKNAEIIKLHWRKNNEFIECI